MIIIHKYSQKNANMHQKRKRRIEQLNAINEELDLDESVDESDNHKSNESNED